ncbi:MAG: hypothetical protein WCK77_11030, partial [Verrucomicrobiota bacterium]
MKKSGFRLPRAGRFPISAAPPRAAFQPTKIRGDPACGRSSSIARPDSRRETTNIMINELITEMVDAGVHYGHQT